MFDSNFDDYEVYLDESDDKYRYIDEYNLALINEELLTHTDCPNYRSCVIRNNIINHDLLGQNEEDNIKELHCNTMVMFGYLVNSSPCKLIDSLNIETNPVGIIFSSFDQKDEVYVSIIHHFQMLYSSLVNLCMLFNIFLMGFLKEDSSCRGKHSNHVFIKRDTLSPYVNGHVNHYNIRRNWKSSLITSLSYVEFMILVLTYIFLLHVWNSYMDFTSCLISLNNYFTSVVC